MKVNRFLGLAVLGLGAFAASARAAFVVETFSDGKASANFAYTSGGAPSFTATPGKAAGLQASQTAFGGTGATSDTYMFSYTPGTDVDNTTSPETLSSPHVGYVAGNQISDIWATDADGAGALSPTFTSNSVTANNVVGGGTGLYDVFISWVASTNINTAGSTLTITHDGTALSLSPVNENTPGSAQNTQTYPSGAKGGSDFWLLIAHNVHLTAGTTYSVTEANIGSPTFVSQRASGVLWQPVDVPEPASLSLVALAAFGLIRRARRP